ncbi:MULTISPECIES: hypothetical protein [unclassified Nodularia (in: cyanobacteria)]|uniref:hypothetical protein n=1 Tax=unclassified Nodularia (in: cyanobacteria) TaxID=2656917 RepID=UPI00187F2BDB|nr:MULTISPECIES: hypothetical protein [unclassified Nodularia (in: cyanobacteria)]MBE9199393.1 hypothetical protein [Nodularia sp. LEGE 06071]MCC2692890.1 hypothetical protein [Nodularia sp. LEGE 04288]
MSSDWMCANAINAGYQFQDMNDIEADIVYSDKDGFSGKYCERNRQAIAQFLILC